MLSSKHHRLLENAKQQQRLGRLNQASILYHQLLAAGVEKTFVLNQLIDICLNARSSSKAIEYFEMLLDLEPKEYRYFEELANLYGQQGQWCKVSDVYFKFIQINEPSVNAECYFNYALNLKQMGEYQQALDNYQLALDHNISQPEEVLVNMSVIYSENLRDEAQATLLLESAYRQNPEYTATLFNLAHLFEEQGDRGRAAEYYQKIMALDPANHHAMARLVEVNPLSSCGDPLILSLEKALKLPSLQLESKIELLYAHGKALDKCEEYDRAFASYTLANHFDGKSMLPYRGSTQVDLVDKNIQFFSREWFDSLPKISSATPVFICGMFRSGSTLVEQILASHNEITAGGESDYFYKVATGSKAQYPDNVREFDVAQLKSIARDYLFSKQAQFPEAQIVTDKRPDNFLFIGLIKSLYPKAKIIYTTRDARDNCLSIYFLRLASAMNYATSLEHTAHYYQQQERLMQHWQSIFQEDIFCINYDQLVIEPEPQIRGLLGFLNLPWSAECLNFHQLKNRVKTASVWQVRQPLYKTSSGRWRNYQSYSDVLAKLFPG